MKRAKLCIAAVVAAALLALLLWRPVRYSRAEKLFQEGDYPQAQELYEGLNYRDAAEKASACSYQLAETYFARGRVPPGAGTLRGPGGLQGQPAAGLELPVSDGA